jgi:hypothetical protein
MQKFIVYKSSAPIRETMPYIIVSCGFYNRSIYAEGYLLVILDGLKPLLFSLEPTHFPQESGLEFAGILKTQFEAAKDRLAQWLIGHTGGRAWLEVQQLSWEEIGNSQSLVPLLADKKVAEKFDEILKATNCTELEKFVSKARDLEELRLLYQL